jgi:hypothetical protein
MKRMCGLCLLLGLGLIALCGVAVFYGHALTGWNSLESVGLTFCDDAPCFMGIIPGFTGWSEVQTRFAGMSTTIDGNQLEFNTAQQLDVYLIRSENKTLVSAVFILFKDSAAMTAGSVIAQFGMPCNITINRRLKRATLEYRTVLAELSLTDTGQAQTFIHARTPVISMSVRSTWNRCAYGQL